MTEFLKIHQNTIRAIVDSTKICANAELIDALPNLEIVATCSVGLDKIDLGKCEEKGIRVTNTPDILTDDVADTAIGLVLGVLTRVCTGDGLVRNGKWKDGNFGLTTKFSDKSAGILVLGRIRTAIARRAEAFCCSISYHSRSQKLFAN